MKIYVSADIEGVTGIAHWDEADRARPDFSWFRDRMNDEVAAACEGALLGGAKELLVKDAHASGRNLFADRLPRPARLIRGWSGHPYKMVQELDGSYAGLCCVGYHSPCASGGHPLSHTLTGKFAWVELDGVRQSELRLNATTAATHGVPLLFVAGDEALCADAVDLDPRVVVVPTGRGVGHSTIGLHPSVVLEKLRDGMATAVRAAPTRAPLPVPSRFHLEVRFRVHHDAYRASHYPGAELRADDRVALESTDWMDVLRALLFW